MAAFFGRTLLGFVLHIVFQAGTRCKNIRIEVGRTGIDCHPLPGASLSAHPAEDMGHF